MASEAFRCQCRRWTDRPCEHTMTREDLLCDTCRDGCSLITIEGQRPFHTKVTDFKYTVTS